MGLFPYSEQVEAIVELALKEDTSQGDVTSDALIPPDLVGSAVLLSKAEGVLSGMPLAEMIFKRVDSALQFETIISDGTAIHHGDILGRVTGKVSSILKAERVVLNFLQRLGGVSTVTSRYVAVTGDLAVQLTDTRKTTPGQRLIEKYAVKMGGGHNHRFHLGDGILVKDNHLVAVRAMNMTFADVVAQARARAPRDLELEIEVTTVEEAIEAVAAGADRILLDNMSVEDMASVVKQIGNKVKTEASGGITLDTLRAVAETGVDYISIGALTHSAGSLDISLEMEADTLKSG